MATTNDLKNGMALNIDGQLWTVVDFQHVKPGKGGAFVRTTLKNVLSGKVVDRTFNAGSQGRRPPTSTSARCSTSTGGRPTSSSWTPRTYDQIRDPRETVGRRGELPAGGADAVVAFNDGVAAVRGAARAVELTTQQTDPGVQGDRSTGGTKPATLETGAEIQVPLFITTGEKVGWTPATGDYLGRA